MMLAAPGSESIREAEEVGFVHGIEYLSRRALGDLILQRGDAQGSLPPVGFRDVHPTDRLRSVRSAVQPIGQIPEILFQFLAVGRPRHAVHPRCSVPLEIEVGLPETVHAVDVVPERPQLRVPISTRYLSYPIERALQVQPGLCPGPVLLSRVPLSSASPLPSIPSAGGVAGTPPVFGDFPGTTGLSDFPRPFIAGYRAPWARPHCGPRCHPRSNVGSPGSRTRCLNACTGSLTAQGPAGTRDIAPTDVAFPDPPPGRLPSHSREGCTPKFYMSFRGSIPDLRVSLSTLRLRSYPRQRMTRGRTGSLRLVR